MKKFVVSVVNFFFEELHKINTKLYVFDTKEDAQVYIQKILDKSKNDAAMSYYRNGIIMYPEIVKTDDKVIITIDDIYFYCYFLNEVEMANKYVVSNVHFEFSKLNGITLDLVSFQTRNDLDKYLDDFVEKIKHITSIGYYGQLSFPVIKRNSARITVHKTMDYYLLKPHIYFNDKFLD